jgi:WD40 repeat protein
LHLQKKRPRSDGDSQLTTQEAPVPQGHTGVVTGVEVDSLNSVIISSSLDGTLRFWDFKTGQQIDVVQVRGTVKQVWRREQGPVW